MEPGGKAPPALQPMSWPPRIHRPPTSASEPRNQNLRTQGGWAPLGEGAGRLGPEIWLRERMIRDVDGCLGDASSIGALGKVLTMPELKVANVAYTEQRRLAQIHLGPCYPTTSPTLAFPSAPRSFQNIESELRP